MYKNENSEIAKGQLIGALIGLARATEGNVNRPTDETDRVFVKAMQISLSDCSCQKICNQIELLHEEKQKLVPRCQKCASPCGRNSDFNITGLNRMKNSQLKYVLLSGLLYMASFSAVSDKNSSVGREIMGFLYKAFFFVGYDCDEESLLPIFRELGEWQSKLYSQYSQPESDE